MRSRHGRIRISSNYAAAAALVAAALMSALLLMPGKEAGALLGAASFWLTVTLAVSGSVLSALCIQHPVAEPKPDPYTFIGQWFVWLATPLLWAAVAGSLTFEWLKPFDLLAALVAFIICRWGAQALCSQKWRTREARRVHYVPYLARPQQDS